MLSIGIESEEQTVQRPSVSGWKPSEQIHVNPVSFEMHLVFIWFEHEKGWLKILNLVTEIGLPKVGLRCCYYIFNAVGQFTVLALVDLRGRCENSTHAKLISVSLWTAALVHSSFAIRPFWPWVASRNWYCKARGLSRANSRFIKNCIIPTVLLALSKTELTSWFVNRSIKT